MKIIRQIGIIFTVCWLSLVIEKLLPFTFPASVIGMILLFLCLFTGVLKIEHIQEKADFLLGNMAFFFVPAGVSIMNYFDVLKHSIVQLVFVCIISTIITFAVTACYTQLNPNSAVKEAEKNERIVFFTVFWNCAKRSSLRNRGEIK